MAKRSDNKKTFKPFIGLVDIPFYPLNYAKVLIQVGHEPLSPFRSKGLFGRENFYYHNVLSYLNYIHSVEGITGLYRGLGMRIISNIVGNQVNAAANKYFDDMEERNRTDDDEFEESAVTLAKVAKQTSREITVRCWSLVISHPFHVMAIRCMAQFVGGETTYSSWNVFQNAAVIYKGEGISGFFSGLVPRLLFEASTIAFTSFLSYVIKTYLLEEKDLEVFVDLVASMLSSSITYPLSVLSTVSCVVGSGLVAGSPPRMRHYNSWIEVFQHLYETDQLQRGSKMFFRLYKPIPFEGSSNGPVVKLVSNLKR